MADSSDPVKLPPVTDRALLADIHDRVAALADVFLAGPMLPPELQFRAGASWLFDMSPLLATHGPYIQLRAEVRGTRSVELTLVLNGSWPVRRWMWNLDGEAMADGR